MDAKHLHNLIDALKAAGRSINEDFVPVLYDSLIRLQSENHFHSVYLWGRVETLSDDYYVAYGHGRDPIEGRTFFYTQNLLEWMLMPTDWSAGDVHAVRRIKTKFTGNPRYAEAVDSGGFSGEKPFSDEPTPSLAVKNDDDDDDDGGDEDDGDDDDRYETDERNDDMKRLESEIFNDPTVFETESEKGTDKPVVAETRKTVKEEDRLAITVKRIDDDGHIVPRGFFYKSPDGKVVKAPYFKGLDYSEIGNEHNFLHINSQRCPVRGTKTVRPDYNGSIDFLESIDNDIPKGCWTARAVFNRYLITHNLLWPGVVFVQDMNTGVHGFFYNGDGMKNLDLPFMI